MTADGRARTNGPAFIVGWVVGLSAVGAIILLLFNGGDASEQGAPADWVSWLKLVLGILLLVVAVRTWRSRPRAGEEADLPKPLRSIDHFTAERATGMGVVLSAVNPKNLLLTVGAAAAIAQTGISSGEQAVALAVFVVIATLGAAIPVAIYFGMREEHAAQVLGEIKDWMARNNAAIMTVLCLIIAAKLIGDAISGLAG